MSKLLEEGSRWRHRGNGHYYKIVTLGLSEADSEKVVVYKADVSKIVWVRPEAEFLEKFERVKW